MIIKLPETKILLNETLADILAGVVANAFGMLVRSAAG